MGVQKQIIGPSLLRLIKADNKGFTLIELLVVIMIIGILMSVALFSNRSMQLYADDGERRDDVASIVQRLEQAYINQDIGSPSYPSTVELLDDATNRSRTLKNINPDTLTAPGETSLSLVAAKSNDQDNPYPDMTASQYVYQPLRKNGTLCKDSTSSTPVSQNCVRFVLYYKTVFTNTLQKINSVHQQ